MLAVLVLLLAQHVLAELVALPDFVLPEEGEQVVGVRLLGDEEIEGHPCVEQKEALLDGLEAQLADVRVGEVVLEAAVVADGGEVEEVRGEECADFEVAAGLEDVALGDDAVEQGSIVDGVDLAVVVLEEGQVGQHNVPVFGRKVLHRSKVTPL